MRACARACAILCVLVALCAAVDGAPSDLQKLATPAEGLLVPPEILQSPSSKPDKDTLCQLRPLTVKFADLGWQDWIIAPLYFEAGYCSGYCSLPHLPNTTNHAIVQAYAHKRQEYQDTLPSPCCVPTEYEPLLSVLHSKEYNIILRKYQDMKVKSWVPLI